MCSNLKSQRSIFQKLGRATDRILDIVPGNTRETAFNLSGKFGTRVFRSSIAPKKTVDPATFGITVDPLNPSSTVPPEGYRLGFINAGEGIPFYSGPINYKPVFVSEDPHYFHLKIRRTSQVQFKLKNFFDSRLVSISEGWASNNKATVLKPGSYYMKLENFHAEDITYRMKLTIKSSKSYTPPKTSTGGSFSGGSSNKDYDCSDFSSQSQAQNFLFSGDPYNLDGDNDGIACESLR